MRKMSEYVLADDSVVPWSVLQRFCSIAKLIASLLLRRLCDCVGCFSKLDHPLIEIG